VKKIQTIAVIHKLRNVHDTINSQLILCKSH